MQMLGCEQLSRKLACAEDLRADQCEHLNGCRRRFWQLSGAEAHTLASWCQSSWIVTTREQ